MNEMLNDRLLGNLFKNNFEAWLNHYDGLKGRTGAIYNMILLCEKLGCDMSAEKIAASSLFAPGAPL